MRVLLFIPLAFGLILQSCGGSSNAETESNPAAETAEVSPSEWKAHEGEHYIVKAPVDWQYDKSGRMNTLFVLFAPVDTLSHGFRENLNLITEDVSAAGMDLNTYVMQSKGMLEEFMNELSDFQLNERDGRYWFTYKARQGIMHLDMTQMFTEKDGLVHILTYTQRVDSETPNKPVAIKVMEGYETK